MIRALRPLALGVAIGLLSGPALTQDSLFWKNVGDWEISIDPTIDNGCYAVATWNGGTVLRIGRNPEAGNFYFLIGNEKWASLVPEQSYDIAIRFGSRAPWEVSASGLQFNPGETVYLHAQSSKMEFIREFQAALNMRISYDGNEIDNLKLNGSRRAWDEVEACQRSVDARGVTDPDDPFAGSSTGTSSRKAEDPFAN